MADPLLTFSGQMPNAVKPPILLKHYHGLQEILHFVLNEYLTSTVFFSLQLSSQLTAKLEDYIRTATSVSYCRHGAPGPTDNDGHPLKYH